MKTKGRNIPISLQSPADAGFCLSAFLVITKAKHKDHVLMGHVNPEAPWDDLGALSKDRTLSLSRGWMLPSSHLIFKESPQEAAQRILKEQLGISRMKLDGPKVASEIWDSRQFNLIGHWDLEFIFTGTQNVEPKPNHVWKELRFVDLKRAKKEDFVRSHEDILGHLGLQIM